MKNFAKKILSDVSEGQEFLLHKNGLRKVRSIIDLRTELEKMQEVEFQHHVSNNKNDFAKWVETCVQDDTLAKDMKLAASKEEIIDLISARIEFAISIIEEENSKIIQEELGKLKKIEDEATAENSPALEKEVEVVEQELKKLQKNINFESKVVNEEELELKHWKDSTDIPANARVAEFLFGLVVGLGLGILIARAILGI
jgi:hypothetical protein